MSGFKEEKMDTREAFYDLFGDDPVNWMKWVVVFAVLILGYVIALPLYKKVEYRLSWDRKRDLARERDHVIEAVLEKKYPSGEPGNYDWHAAYRYTVGGKQKKYNAFFKHPQTPPLRIFLYYLNNPGRVFSYEEYHYENHKAVLLLPVMLLPWILAILTFVVLGIEIPG